MRNSEQKSFLERIRSSDEHIKRRWVVVVSVCAMAIVIFLWLGYFNTMMTGFNAESQENVTLEQLAKKTDALSVARAGLGTVYHVAQSFVSSLMNVVGTSKEYVIK